MSHALLDNLAKREDTKLVMAGVEVMIVASFVRRVVDMTYDLGILREDRSVFGQLLPPCSGTVRGVVLCRRCVLRFRSVVLATATTGRIKKRLHVHNLAHRCSVLSAMRVGCHRVRRVSRGLGKCRSYRGHEYETALSYDEAEVRSNATSLAAYDSWAQSVVDGYNNGRRTYNSQRRQTLTTPALDRAQLQWEGVSTTLAPTQADTDRQTAGFDGNCFASSDEWLRFARICVLIKYWLWLNARAKSVCVNLNCDASERLPRLTDKQGLGVRSFEVESSEGNNMEAEDSRWLKCFL